MWPPLTASVGGIIFTKRSHHYQAKGAVNAYIKATTNTLAFKTLLK